MAYISPIQQMMNNMVGANRPATTATGAAGFNVSPAPQQGNGTFGAVPGQIGMPSPATDLGANFPNLAGTNAQVSSNILSKLRGQLSPGTQAAIQDASARFGVSSGMPGSGLAGYKSLRDLGLLSEQVQQQGIQDYASIIPTISRTQTVSPETQIGLAERNAMMAAAPDPTASNLYSQSLFNNYMRNMAQRSPSGGTPWWMQGGSSGTAQAITPNQSTMPPDRFPESDGVPTGEDGYDPYYEDWYGQNYNTDNTDYEDAYNWLDVEEPAADYYQDYFADEYY